MKKRIISIGLIVTFERGGYEFASGTSMAVPVVSGIASLIYLVSEEMDAIQAKKLLMKSVYKIGELERKIVSGGMVKGDRAIKLALERKE